MRSKEKLSIITLGCKKNLVDSERLLFKLKNHYDFTEEALIADVVLINTCGFINDAKIENIDIISQFCKLKEEKQIHTLIVFGCLVQVISDDIKNKFPEIDYLFGTNSIDDIANVLLPENNNHNIDIFNREFLTKPPTSYLKIAEGCNHRCSFCSIPFIRGNQVSIKMEDLINEANIIRSLGYKELVIIAQDTSNYGIDIYGKKMLPELLNKLADIDFEWIRLMYTYPTAFPEEALNVINERDNICKYIDIPIQHISDKILKSMKRGINKVDTIKLIEKIKNIIPNVAIRSTFIVGYPNETDDEFNELLDFIKNYELDRVGAFTYSPQRFTSSYELTDNVPTELKLQRYEELMLQQQKISLKKNKQFYGKNIKVLIDGEKDNYFIGRTEHDAPEIDNEVLIEKNKRLEIGNFYQLRIKNYNEYQLFA